MSDKLKITTNDKIYIQAKNLVLKEKNSSVSFVQRKLEIGYNKAQIIMNLLKENGVVSEEKQYGI